MKILNFGSLNIDYIYRVNHIGAPGETLAAESREVFCGGKGLNQSIALARAGATAYHAGCIGEDGQMLKELFEKEGVDCRYVITIPGPSGHAVIQVEDSGQNAILLFGGANQQITPGMISLVFAGFKEGDWLLLQNEINCLPEIVEAAYAKGMKIALNPSPYHSALEAVDLNKIHIFLLNEVEGRQITGFADPEDILAALSQRYPESEIVLTLGRDGAVYCAGEVRYEQAAYPVEAIDTTGAGDTFTGYFLANLMAGESIPTCMDVAARAAALAVTRPGAAPAIPYADELKK